MIERALMGHEVIWDGVFGGRMEDKNHVIIALNDIMKKSSLRSPGAALGVSPW